MDHDNFDPEYVFSHHPATPKKLEELHARLRAFAAALSSKACEVWTAVEVGKLLASQRLDAGSLRTNYCVPAKR